MVEYEHHRMLPPRAGVVPKYEIDGWPRRQKTSVEQPFFVAAPERLIRVCDETERVTVGSGACPAAVELASSRHELTLED